MCQKGRVDALRSDIVGEGRKPGALSSRGELLGLPD